MNDMNTAHFLEISGDVARNKEKEFEQTIRFVFNQLPAECIERGLAADVHITGHYYFFSIWKNERSLLRFMDSDEFQLVTGAYDALGTLEKTVYGAIT